MIMDNKRDKFGFIITRYVNSEKTNNYWIECYNCIRKFYKNKIIIIDDNSNPEYLNSNIELENCQIIQSEYPQRGEILAYYYFYKYYFFENAIIIHDSVFIQNFIDFDKKYNNTNIKFIWDFAHTWDTPEDEITLLHNILQNKNYSTFYNLLIFYNNKDKWL